MSEGEAAAPASEGAPAPAPGGEGAPAPSQPSTGGPGPGGAPAPAIGDLPPKQQPAAPSQPSQDTPTWMADMPDDMRGFVQNKGWESPDQIIGAYQNLEKHVGKKPLSMPKGPDDTEGWESIYTALGRPDAPDGYELDVPEGSPEGFADEAAQVFHEQGLSKQQAQEIVNWYNERSAEMANQTFEQLQQQGEQELQQLQQDWGDQYDAKVAKAQQAAAYFDIDAETLNAIELGQPLGAKRLMEFLANLGENMSEDRFVDGDGGPGAGFGMTQEAASARIKELRGSKEFQQRMANKEPEAQREWDDLHKVAYPGNLTLD